jgi:hypothetical protein
MASSCEHLAGLMQGDTWDWCYVDEAKGSLGHASATAE